MNDFLGKISVTESGEEISSVGNLIRLTSEGKSIADTIDGFLNLVSEAFCPSRCIWIFQDQLSSFLQVKDMECNYAHSVTEFISPNQNKSWISKMTESTNMLEFGLTSEIVNETLKQEVEEAGVLSYLVVSLEYNKTKLGTIVLIDVDTTRLWSNLDLDIINSLAKIWSQYIHISYLESQIASKESLLQTAIENSNDGFWYIDLIQNKMTFSKQWKCLLGYEEDELLESFETFENLIHPDDRALVLQVLDPYLKIGVDAYECEYRIQEKSGKYLWVLTRANVKYSVNGIPIEFVATNTDITSRIEYKRQLAKSEAKYEDLIGSIHEVLFKIDRKGIITFLNQAWEHHLLLKVDKTIGTEAIKYMHPDDRHIGLTMLQTQYEGVEEKHISTELRFLGANGNVLWMEIHGSIRFSSEGLLEGISGTLINVNDKKLEAKAKQASENKLTRISENISDLISEIDEEGKYIFVSKAVRGMLGRNAEDLIGKKSIFDVHPDDRDLVKKNLFNQLQAGANRVVEQYRVKTGSGKYIWIETIIQPLFSSTGKRTFISASRDISARRKVEEEMTAALQKERDLNELKSRFITMTSHEFRTPLSNIQSSIDILEMYAEELGDRFIKPFESHFGKITSQVGRINSLLTNIDTLGRIEAMDMPFNPKKQNIVRFTSNLIDENVSKLFSDRRMIFEVVGNKDVGIFDAELMQTLLSNIIKNAFLYSTKEDPKCNLILDETEFKFIVSDTGLGIPEDEISHLFTSFFRAKNIVNLNISGNGLGLVISKKIAEIHKGSIDVESQENIGTTVTVTIPNGSKK